MMYVLAMIPEVLEIFLENIAKLNKNNISPPFANDSLKPSNRWYIMHLYLLSTHKCKAFL